MAVKIERNQPIKIERGNAKIQRGRVRIERNAPDFQSMFEEDGDPLADVTYPGDVQGNADAEMSEILRQIIERKKQSAERFRITSDPEYFICLCFQSRDQKEEFLQKTGWLDQGDKYLNGLEIARRLGVELTIIPLEPPRLRGNKRKFLGKEVLGNA